VRNAKHKKYINFMHQVVMNMEKQFVENNETPSCGVTEKFAFSGVDDYKIK
jgi:hypothetical protein